MPVVPKICPLMQRDYCQRENCAIWHHDRCGLIVDGVLIGHGIRRAMGEETAEDTKELEDMDQLIEDMS